MTENQQANTSNEREFNYVMQTCTGEQESSDIYKQITQTWMFK